MADKAGIDKPVIRVLEKYIFSVWFPNGKTAIVSGLWKIHTKTEITSITSEKYTRFKAIKLRS